MADLLGRDHSRKRTLNHGNLDDLMRDESLRDAHAFMSQKANVKRNSRRSFSTESVGVNRLTMRRVYSRSNR